MRLASRPPRIPLACPCGARLSVIPRLQSTEVNCPRCQKTLSVPAAPEVQITDAVPEASLEPTILAVPAVARRGLGVRENTAGNAELTAAASEPILEPLRGIGESSLRQVPITSRDRDIFGYLLTDPAASLNCMLEEKIPKSIRTLKMESQYTAAQRHIEQLLIDGKVRAVQMDTSEVGYIINPDWLTQLRKIPPVAAAINAPVVSVSEEPPQRIGVIRPPSDQPRTNERDIFGRIPGHGAAHMNTFLSETIPRTIRTLRELSEYKNTANHIQQLRKEGKIKEIPLQGGRVGWIIDPDWLKAARDSMPFSERSAANADRSEATVVPPRRDEADEGSVKPSEIFRPIGLTQPTRKPKSQQSTGSLFKEQQVPFSKAKSDAAGALPTSLTRSELTSGQQKVFESVERYYASKGISPTIPELQAATLLNRFDTLNDVDALVRKGLFEFDRSAARGIRIIPEADRLPINDPIEPVLRPVQPDTAVSRESTREREYEVDKKTDASGGTGDVQSHKESSDAPTAAAIPKWVDWLFDSELLNQRFEAAGRRVPPREQVRALLSLLAREGSFASRETVCSSLVLPPIRYEGFIAVAMRIMNVDNVPILTKTEGGDGVRLNISLLHHQFEIPK